MPETSVPRTPPAEVNGLPVVASVSLPDIAGYMPSRHVVIVRAARSHTVWPVSWSAFEGGTWIVTGPGHYGLPYFRAVTVMAETALSALRADGLASAGGLFPGGSCTRPLQPAV